jgi:hypothetical protein
MRISAAASELDMTPRMLRYRESLGLLPELRQSRRRGPASRRPPPGGRPGSHRQFSDADIAAVALGQSIERRYDISPVALSFAIRILADPVARTDVAELGRRIGRLQPSPARAQDFEQERAQRLLQLSRRESM